MAALLHSFDEMSTSGIFAVLGFLLAPPLAFTQGTPYPPYPSPYGTPGNAVVNCYNSAVTFGLLSKEDALNLCQGTTSSAPWDCYQQATQRALLDNTTAIKLCRCTMSTGRVDCYIKAHSSTNLTDNQILDLCTHDVTFNNTCK